MRIEYMGSILTSGFYGEYNQKEMSMKDKKFALIFSNVDESHLGKDVFLVPYYWCYCLSTEKGTCGVAP